MTVEEHHSAEEFERLFREEKSARMAKRIWIVWQARLGHTEPEITAEISLACRTVQQCVRCYNTAGFAGLQDRVGRGLKPPLSRTEETLFRQRIEAEPQRSDEVCSWRGVDCQRFLETQFGQQKSLSAVSWLLHRLGYETPAQEARPQAYELVGTRITRKRIRDKSHICFSRAQPLGDCSEIHAENGKNPKNPGKRTP